MLMILKRVTSHGWVITPIPNPRPNPNPILLKTRMLFINFFQAEIFLHEKNLILVRKKKFTIEKWTVIFLENPKQ